MLYIILNYFILYEITYIYIYMYECKFTMGKETNIQHNSKLSGQTGSMCRNATLNNSKF